MQTLRDLVTSKKFIAMIVGVVIALAAKKGLDLDPDMTNNVVYLVIAYIVGQGVADHGKEKALVDQATTLLLRNPPMAVVPVPVLVREPEKGGGLPPMLHGIALFQVIIVFTVLVATGCPAHTGNEHLDNGVNAAEKCVLGDAANLVGDAVTALKGDDYEQKLKDLASTKSLTTDAVTCLVQAALAALTSATPAHAEPTAIVLHARAYLDSRKK